MCLLFETIQVKNGVVRNIEYHQQRVNISSSINLMEYVDSSVIIPKFGLYKLRVTYSESAVVGHNIERYTPKKVESLRVITDNDIDYHKKFDDRTSLNNLLMQKEECDDILILKNGMITDISFANIIFFDGEKWVTPTTPLLEGSCRARLIDINTITPHQITYSDLEKFSHFMTINAMLDFEPARAIAYTLKAGIIAPKGR